MMHENISAGEAYLLHVYNRFPVTLERGEGVYLYDTQGKPYLDFAAGIAVCGLGYANPRLEEALIRQGRLLWHTSNLFYHRQGGPAAQALAQAAGMDAVFFTNSGAEAVEGALKAARRFAERKGKKGREIIAMEHAFHGRTLGALSVTGKEAYRAPFEPLLPGVRFARFNDLASVEALFTEETCGVILEPVQGEGGVYPADPHFLEGVRRLCDAHGALLIFDEIQCGMGRTGTMFAWQGYGVKPDLITLAKGIGNGFPVGAFCMTQEVAESSLEPGDHGTTYGGNPLATALVQEVLALYQEMDLCSHVKRLTPLLEEALEDLVRQCPSVRQRRGRGFLQGLVLEKPVGEVITGALQEGLLVISAEGNVLRLAPPLIIQEEHIREMTEKLKKVL